MIKVQKVCSQAENWPFVLPMIESGVKILYFVHDLVCTQVKTDCLVLSN